MSDLISKGKLLERIEQSRKAHRAVRSRLTVGDMEQMIKSSQSVDAVPVRHGKWKYYPNASVSGRDVWVCSECETGYSYVQYHNYCPNCGAKMDGDVNA